MSPKIAALAVLALTAFAAAPAHAESRYHYGGGYGGGVVVIDPLIGLAPPVYYNYAPPTVVYPPFGYVVTQPVPYAVEPPYGAPIYVAPPPTVVVDPYTGAVLRLR